MGFHPQPMPDVNVIDKQRTIISDDDTDDDIRFSITEQRDKPSLQCICGRVINVEDNSLSPKTSGLVSPKTSGVVGVTRPGVLSPISGVSNLQIDVNDSLQSWLNNLNMNVAAIFPENFRYIISGPSECGKTILLKNLMLDGVDFVKIYIIGPTGNQYNDLGIKTLSLLKI